MLAVIADDLTGALDTGIQFQQRGFTTRVVLPPFPPGSLEHAAAEVVVVDTETRHATGSVAAETVVACAGRLRSAGATRFYKKIDSTLRGPWPEELAALRRTIGVDHAVLCPAFPALGRTVRGAEVYVRDQLLAAEQPAVATLRAGERSVSRGDWDDLSPTARPPVVLADAETEGDLDAIVAWAMARSLDCILCGSGGLAAAWARARRPDGRPASRMVQPCRRVLVVAGSSNPVTLLQIEALQRHLELSAGNEDIVLLIRGGTGTRPEDVSTAEALATEAAKLHAVRPVDGWVLTGGETAYRVLRALGAASIRLECEALPGMPMSTVEGGPAAGCCIVTKAGGFGDPAALVRTVERLRSFQ